MYNSILVPVSFDADRNAEKAVSVAQALLAEGGRMSLLHVVEHLPQYSADLLPADHFEIAKATITEKLQPLTEGLDGVAIEIVEGHSGRTILDYAASHDVDCIVIASHRPGLQDYLLGSTAARVVRHSPCSVHIVR